MGVLQFDGVDDKLKWTTLAQALKDVADGAWTLAVVLKRNNTASWDGIAYLLSGTGSGTTEAGASFSNTHASSLVDAIVVDVASSYSNTATQFQSTTSVYLIVVSKGAGTVAPRVGWKAGSGGAWTHENCDATLADQIDATMFEIGAWQGTDFFKGWIGLVGFWEGAMSDAHKEALDDSWRTSDWWNSAHGQPKFLAELNVAGASVVDLAGNASDLTATGTTLDSGETLDSWNFNGKGAVEFAAAVAGQAAVTADVVRQRALEAAVAGQAAVSADFVRQLALGALVAGTAAVTADTAVTKAFEAVVAGQAQVLAGVDAQRVFAAVAAGQATVVAAFEIAGAPAAVVQVGDQFAVIYHYHGA